MDIGIGSRAQHIVLTKVLGVKKIYAIIGFSMGGQQVSSIFSHRPSKADFCVVYNRLTIGLLFTRTLWTGAALCLTSLPVYRLKGF